MIRSERNRFWVLSELYYPEDSATGYYVTRIAESLAASHNVNVLCAQPTYKARGTKAPSEEIRNNVHIHRCAATTLDKDVLTFRLINLFTISVSIFFNAVRGLRRGDLALVVTNPPALPFVALLACRLRGAKLILRIEDVYPDAMIAAGMVGPDSLIVRLLNVLHRFLYTKVDRVIVLGRDMLQLVEGKVHQKAGGISIITNWGDVDQVTPGERSSNPLLQRHGLTEKFIVQYSGNMGRTHDLENLVECARILAREESVHFLFIGTGAKEQWLRKTARELGLANITILPPQPRSALTVSLNACDLAVVSFVRGMAGVSVPSRMYNILAAGKPILAVADADSELALVIQEERVGWLVRPASPERSAQAILEAFSSPTLLSEMSKRARALVLKSYTQMQIMGKFEDLLESVASSRNHASRSGS
jgi:colanic acid biosynthesis glycosyl transferase WcaI